MRNLCRLLSCLLPCLALAAISSCAREQPLESASSDAVVHPVRGIVRGPYAAGSITIEHEAVRGYMPAMTMPFNVAADDVQSLAPGDRVEFELHVSGDTSRATRFRKVGRVADESPTAVESPRRSTARLRPGDTLPDFELVDQDGKPFRAESLHGRHTVLTFIFTRCPVPEFCPLLGRKFQALQAALAERKDPPDKVQLVSVTIDPEHDRPPVLQAYGKSQHANFARWRFVTGDSAIIDDLTARFAVRTERRGATLDHTLATALIAPDGRIVEIWRGNAWKPEEILAALPPPQQ